MVDREVEKEEEGGSSTSCAAHLCLQVYLPLEGVGAKCSRQCPADAEAGEGLQPVSWELGVRQVSLKVRGYKEGRTLLFEVKRLGGDIVPEACTFKVSSCTNDYPHHHCHHRRQQMTCHPSGVDAHAGVAKQSSPHADQGREPTTSLVVTGVVVCSRDALLCPAVNQQQATNNKPAVN
ncbi:hypothetical protein QJQ45_024796, partial [Haematococcus lacustris]